MNSLGPTLSLAFALVIAVPANAGPLEDSLTAQGDKWNAAYSAGDWADLRALYADDAWLMTDKAPVAKGADAIITYLRRFKDRGGTVTFRFEPEDVQAKKPYGFVIARYWMSAQLPGGAPPIRSAGRSILIYKWQGGGWKLWRDMDNTTPDVTPE